MSLGLNAQEIKNVMTRLGWQVCPEELNKQYRLSEAAGEFTTFVPPNDFQKSMGIDSVHITLSVGQTPHFIKETSTHTYHAWFHGQKFIFHMGHPVDRGHLTPMTFEAGIDRAAELGKLAAGPSAALKAQILQYCV